MNFNPNNVIIALNCASFVVYLLFSSCYGGPYSHYKIQNKLAGKEAIEEVQSQSKLRSEFLQVLRTRRPAQVPPTIEPAKPVENPLYQISPPTREEIEILESTPKADIDNLDELLEEENLYLNIEKGEQGRLPVLILKLKKSNKQRKRPAVVFLHSSYSNKESLRPLLKAYASRGYIAISVDSRYHGERATNTTTYIDALISAWKTGIHAWFAAFADTSYAVAVPGFRWAIDNDEFQGRVETIKPLFEVARDDLGKAAIDKDVVEKVWDRIAPGLASQFDSPYSIPVIAPRRLLILNGAEDPQCPLGGLEIPRTKASKAYRMFNCSDNFKFIAEPGIRHQITRFQMKESADWFDMNACMGFQWAIDNDKCQGRVDSIKPLFEVARDDLGKVAIDKKVARKAWDRIAPGLASQFDSPYSIPTIAPHPLLILNGAEDPRCPLGGLEIPREKATKAYRKFHCLDNFRFIAEAGIGHQVTRFMIKESADWFDSKIQTKMAEKEAVEEAQSKFRSEFLQVLRSRRPAQVPLTVELAKPVANPLHQDSPPSIEGIEIMESCPKADIENLEDLLEEENLYLNTEEGEQGRLPLLVLKLKESDKQRKRPAVVFLHSTNKYKEAVRPLLKAYASRGYIAISVDSRYHGERATSATAYRDVWDLIKLADYLTHREDVDPSRIGITGISLGGMHAWFAAVADTRYAVVAPLIGVQGFRWAMDNDKWQARVDSIKPLFEVARDDLGKGAIDKEVVEKVWDRIAPGLASQFDSPYSVPTIAPRPLLIVNGAEDPRCPVAGLEIPRAKASWAYGEFDCLDNFKIITEPGVGHQLTRLQRKMITQREKPLPTGEYHRSSWKAMMKVALHLRCESAPYEAQPSLKLTHSKIQTKMVEKEAIEEAQSKLQSEFLQILRSRRPAQVPLTVQLAKPVANPLFQDSPPSIKEVSTTLIAFFFFQFLLQSCNLVCTTLYMYRMVYD
ncbi:putative hydrolase YtaP [Glycine soja]